MAFHLISNCSSVVFLNRTENVDSPRERICFGCENAWRKALEAIRTSLVATKVDKAIKTLEKRFGRTKYIIDELKCQVTGIPNMKEDKPMISNLMTAGVKVGVRLYPKRKRKQQFRKVS